MTHLEAYNNVLRSCNMLYFHFVWGLSIMVLGAFVVVTRLRVKWIVQNLRPWHAALGQTWMYGAIVQMATSLYCRSDGFRTFIFGFLVIMIVNMIIAHASIRVYQRGMQRKVGSDPTRAQRELEGVELTGSYQANTAPGGAPDTGGDRAFGLSLAFWKYLHGFTMTLSYLMVFGAGIMFIRRSKDLQGCKDFRAMAHGNATSNGSVIFDYDGVLYMGGANWAPPQLNSDFSAGHAEM